MVKQQTLPAEPLPLDTLNAVLEDFYQNGVTIVRNVLSRETCERIVARLDEIFAEPYFMQMRNVKGSRQDGKDPIVVHRLFECDLMFRDLLVREPIISIAETVLGEHCHCIAQGCILNRKDLGINRFHIDDGVEFPITPEMDRHDPRLRMPVLRMSVQIALSDQDEVKYGPSQFVPGSHYSGRQPEDPEHPTFEGKEPVFAAHESRGSLSTQRANVASRRAKPDGSRALPVPPSLRTTLRRTAVLALPQLPYA